MTNEDLKSFILKLEPEAEISEGKQYMNVILPKDNFHAIAKQLKESDETAFDYLFCLSGVDYPEYIMVVYHLESSRHKHSLVLKIKTGDRENPEVETVSDIWRTADYHEREVFDLLGVKFTNHPDLRRLFLDENWGFPLRKDYVDEIRIVER